MSGPSQEVRYRGIAATRSLHVLTGMSGELDRAVIQEGRASGSCNSTTDSSSCARSNPARPLFGVLLRSLSNSALRRRYPVSRARSKSATVYCRGSGRVRFLRGPFAALRHRATPKSQRIPPIEHIQRGFVTRPGSAKKTVGDICRATRRQ